MQTRHKTRAGLLAWIAITVLLLALQGCAHTTAYRGVPPAEAAGIVAKLTGTARPSSTTLGNYYQAEEKKISWRGTWNCNGQLVIVTMVNLVLTAGEGNAFEGTRSVVGDSRCTSLDTNRIAGRYDDNHLYFYYPDSPETYINKYEIRKSRYDNGTLVFLGQLKYIDNVWGFHKGRANPEYGLTGQKIPESGGPADMWESTELRRQTTDPRLTTEQRRRQVANEEGRKAGALASEIAGREAEYDADERAANRAANAAAFNAITQNMAAESARRRAEAAQPRSNLLADSQRAADAARAATERRAEAARQRNAATAQPSRLTASTSSGGNTASASVSSASRTAPSVPARPATTPSASMPMPTPPAATGGRASHEPTRTYTCPSSKYFTSSIHYRGPNKEETFTFEEACVRAGREAAAFAANVGTPVSYTYGRHVVKRVDTCHKTRSGEQAVVYVHMEGPSSEPCGAPGTAVSR